MIRALLVAGAWLALTWLDARTPAPAGVLRADFGVSAGILIISFLGGLFGLFGGKIDKNVKRALEGLRSIITAIGQTAAEFARDTASVFGTVLGLLRKFWDRILFPLIRRLDGYVVRLFKWLRDTFGPIIEFLREVRRKILDFYNKWFRPIFDTIDAIRRVLGVLSFFGLSWARELDAKLAALQDALMRPIRLLLEKLNEVIDIVDRIMTLDGLLQRITLLRSVARDVGRIGAIWHAAHSKPLTPAEKDAIGRENPWPTSAQILVGSRLYVETGEGPQSGLIAELVLDSRRRLGVG